MVLVSSCMQKDLAWIGPNLPVSTAASIMRCRGVGSLVVMQDGRMIGIVTERDIVHKVIALHRIPEWTRVAAIMSRSVVSIASSRSLYEAADLMSRARIRHLPVEEADGVVGIFSARDLLRPLAIDDL
ncbi:MAG: CBS domain-containing protein [Nitrospirae bacterium]|nr:MAG: CBS domain-containing protein [Nitrospirota bacterium]